MVKPEITKAQKIKWCKNQTNQELVWFLVKEAHQAEHIWDNEDLKIVEHEILARMKK